MTDISAVPDKAYQIVPSDEKNGSFMTLYVGEGGDVTINTEDGQKVTLSNVPSGALIPLRISRVFATGTTASKMVGFR